MRRSLKGILNLEIMNSKLFIFSLLLLVFSACSLNAEQEASLSESTTRFLESRRKGALLAYVSMHHPDVVRYYKEQGDEIFTEKFVVTASEHFADEAIIQETEKNGKEIHVLYKSRKIDEWNVDKESGWDYFVAISDDNGKTWFYMDKQDYVNKSIAKGLKRLIEVKE